MKYIKLYENFKEIDPFDEEDWDEVEIDTTSFLYWLKKEFPNKNNWKNITIIDCYYQKLENLKGIENLINLKHLNCSHNNLINLKGIEKLTKLYYLNCNYNKLTSLNEIKNLINLEKLVIDYNQLTSLKGIENLINLKYLFCGDQLTNLKEIENLINLKGLYCRSYDNLFTKEYKQYLINYCKRKNIYLRFFLM